jgi:hypothetical protein
MTTSSPSQKRDFSRPIIKIIAAIVIAVVVIVLVVDVVIPYIHNGIGEQTSQSTSSNFEFLSKSGWTAEEGGFLGIGADYVVYVQATIKNIRSTAEGCTVNARVFEGGSYWTKSQNVYVSAGEQQTITLRFPEPISGPTSYTIWLS